MEEVRGQVALGHISCSMVCSEFLYCELFFYRSCSGASDMNEFCATDSIAMKSEMWTISATVFKILLEWRMCSASGMKAVFL